MMWAHPQNPYDSFLVQASAGSGKTYQLSKRYMNLVASGAHPAHILTITFTVKAASEMRARIISLASQLLSNESLQNEFDEGISWYFRRAQKQPENQGRTLPPPCGGKEAARIVLANTQMLKIMTIDALFREWTGRFPFESSSEKEGLSGRILSPGFRLGDPMELKDLDEKAWIGLFSNPDHQDTLNTLWKSLRDSGLKKGPLNMRGMLEELFRFQTFLWSAGWQGQGAEVFREHVVKSPEKRDESTEDLIKRLSVPLKKIAAVTKRYQELQDAVERGSLRELTDLRLLTRENRVHGGTIRGKKREELSHEICLVEEALLQFFDQGKLRLLNQVGASLYRAYEAWVAERERGKNGLNLAEFSDLTTGCFQLFHQDKGAGAVWQIQQNIRHLMFDEFQDTSLTQWGIFDRLTNELLAGEGASEARGLFSTVFIVGDKKQSVYGFREADPQVMTVAEDSLLSFRKKKLPLNDSFRTAQLILDFVNRLFSGLMSSFPKHQTFGAGEGQPFIPDQSRVLVHQLFESDDKESGLEKEACFVADFIFNALGRLSDQYPVYERKSGGYRPLLAKDCCILYRNATHAGEFEKALREKGLPYRREERKGFFERSEIRDMLAFFRYLLNPSDAVSLLTLLKSPVFSMSDQMLSGYLVNADLFSGQHSESFRKFREMVEKQITEDGCSLESLRESASEFLPHQLLTRFFKHWDVTFRYEQAWPLSEGVIARRNLIKLVEICSNLEDEGYVTLSQCLRRLEALMPFDEWASATGEEDVVSLMTIHKAKGLEFPLVMVVEAGELWFKADRYWIQRKDPENPGVSFIGSKSMQPASDRHFTSLLSSQAKTMEEEAQRLLYVALTRASQYLVMSGHKPFRPADSAFLSPALSAIRDMGGKEESEYGGVELVRQVAGCGPGFQPDQPESPGSLLLEQVPPANWKSRVELPVETDIVNPHAGEDRQAGRESGGKNRQESRAVSAAMGTFIHKALECLCSGRSFEAKRIWNEALETEPLIRREKSWEEKKEGYFQHCLSEFLSVSESAAFKGLLAQAREIRPELSVVSMQNQKLIRGQVDLFLRYDDHIKIIDYKTGYVPDKGCQGPLDWETVLREHSGNQGYQYQLSLYARSFRQLYPGVKIVPCILFTRVCYLLALNDLSF